MRVRLEYGNRWITWLLAVLLAAGLTAMVMRVSMQRGRLAEWAYPRMDDVIYMARGAELWKAGHEGWMRGGGGVAGAVQGVARDWRKDPPHAPWASGCAAMGFELFGVREWAAYVGTGVPVLAFLLAASRLARRAGGRWGWRCHALMLWAATAPFLAASVYNLKPDYCAGICAAIAMMKALRGPLARGRWGRLAWVGAWFGLALLAKPAMMVPTVLLAAGTLGICTLRDMASGGRHAAWGPALLRVARAWLIVLGVMVVVALPHYVFAFGHAWRYAKETMTGPGEDLWAYRGTTWEHITYYLTGPGGRLMLGGWRSLVPIGIVVGVSVVITVFKTARIGPSGLRRRRAVYGAAMLLCLLMAWAGPTIASVKIAQFASCFSALLWLCGIHAAAGLCAGARESGQGWKRRPILASMAVIAVTGVSFLCHRWTIPLASADRNHPAVVRSQARGEVVRTLYEAVRSEASRGANSIVAAGNANDLGPFLLTLWTVRDGIRIMVDGMDHRPGPSNDESGRASVRSAFARYDLVLVNEGGARVGKISAANANALYRSIAASDPDLELVTRVTDPVVGNVFELYRRRPATRDENESQ